MAVALEDRAKRVFGDHYPQAVAFWNLLVEHGFERGLIGPREVDRLWERHILNSAVVAELLPEGCRVVDVGSGAGLPGIPLAIARPDLDLTLLEPMARRVAWLTEVVDALGLKTVVLRGRAEEAAVRERLAGSDVVTARAVAPLERLTQWCLPLVRPGGQLVALKGESAAEELERDAEAVRRAGGIRPRVVVCGGDVLELPTTVVLMERDEQASRRDGSRRKRKDR
ncbi:16S rRNA (guanine(527)-N(7))-methyltransferase RsmG [Actinosynnema sp. NPDC047251]|uniref:Ribosomal RNA small subunit methyltransferase G n=1 Tax=Saccharothrix espanaensis (strain ATCC 51144 / DSM 44229 / JCM 9112 / NBRC 15066 / NRRL 15764) TaxID=1179773 RepID=K0K659_SACES|nr:16S rRNA (guanine(527)-N(7))-methyltransferase RsmG [Saccharothrix espanaensis]CCH35755.1 Ribosomal RNA small subunit methyltransferase G [Saccharothrix espanaensis DSM 44229]